MAQLVHSLNQRDTMQQPLVGKRVQEYPKNVYSRFSMKDGYIPTKKQELKVTKKPNILDKMPAKSSAIAASNSDSSHQKLEEMMEEIKKLKATILKHEIRIRDLESKLESQGSRLTGNKPVHSSANSHGEPGLLPDEV